MSVLRNERCEFCLKVKKYVSANSIHGFYCEDCLRNARKEEAFSLSCINVARYEDNQRKKLNEPHF